MLSRSAFAARSLARPAILKQTAFRTYATGKDVRYGDQCRSSMLKGVQMISEAVAVTLGPRGRNVVLEQSYGAPKITKDGVTVAKHIEFADRHHNLGAQLVRQVASKTNDVAGDGTTTATILTSAIFTEGCKAVAAGMNPMDLKRGIDMAVKAVVENLAKQSKMITSTEEIKQVATISANGDHDIGGLIATAMEKVGKEGVITTAEGSTLHDELEIVEGMRFDRGFISAYFVNNQKTQHVEFEDSLFLLFDKKISSINQIVPALEISVKKQRPLVIIAEDIEGDALSTLIINKLRNGLKVCAVKAPGFGDHRKNNLQDIAILTGGTLITEELGLRIEDVTESMLGSSRKLTITKEDTIILNGGGSKESIEERCQQLREAIAIPNASEYEREKLQERLAKLSGGVAVLKIGGSTEVEINEKKDRITDALNATRAAVAEGIVAGGGSALLYASIQLDDIKSKNFDQNHGIKIIKEAIRIPVKTISRNAGIEGAVIVEKLLEANDHTQGYDAASGEFCNMLERGVIDPTKVVRTALIDAASVAGLLTTSEAAVVEVEKKGEDKAAAAAQGMGGYGGDMF